MLRPITHSVVLFSLAVAISLVLGPAAQAREKHPIILLAKKMNEKVDYPGLDDTKATLLDALDMLRSLYKLNFDVNENAFKAEGLQEPLGFPVSEKPIPKMSGVTLDAVLKKILARVTTTSGATYIFRKDGIEITTNQFKTGEFYRRPSSNEAVPNDEAPTAAPLFPLAQLQVEKTPLEDALTELCESTSYNLVLDVRAAEKVKVQVTATLTNAPLDTAVRVLADMAGLKPVFLDNVIYVTTRENAKKLESEQKPPALPGGGGFGGLGGIGLGGGGLGGLGGLGFGLGGFYPGGFGGGLGGPIPK